MSQASKIAMRRLTTADIEFGMELKNLAGWNQLPVDWERFIEWEPDGCFLATWDGQRAGTATTINYEGRFGWVGMVLVHPDMRRKGIGTALLMRCIEYLESAGVDAMKLDATPAGKQLYDTLGFVDEYTVERHSATATAHGPQEGVAPMTEDHVSAVREVDLAAFGADRSRVFDRLQREDRTSAFVALEGSQVTGYVFVRPGMNADYIGPWVARDADSAERLLRQALSAVSGKTVFVDISLAHDRAAPSVAKHGFERQRTFTRMFRGCNTCPGRTELVYGVAGVEIG